LLGLALPQAEHQRVLLRARRRTAHEVVVAHARSQVQRLLVGPERVRQRSAGVIAELGEAQTAEVAQVAIDPHRVGRQRRHLQRPLRASLVRAKRADQRERRAPPFHHDPAHGDG